jgi:protein-S-isoprenylcysteine O-methyltransferase Ste14
VLAAACILLPGSAHAADIRLTLGHRSVNDSVVVSIENNASQDAFITAVSAVLDGKKYEQAIRRTLKPGEKHEAAFTVTYPDTPGTYPLTAAVSYLNEGRMLSLKHTALYNFIDTALLDVPCRIDEARFTGEGAIILRSPQPRLWQLVLPDEIEVTGTEALQDRKIVHVRTRVPDLQCAYTIFAVAEQSVGGKHCSALVAGSLTTGLQKTPPRNRGRLSSSVVLLQVVFFFIAALCCTAFCKQPSRVIAACCKYACRMFFVTAAYLVLRHADTWLELLLPCIAWQPVQYLLTAVRDNLRGSNYDYFFTYVVDGYWAACLLLTLPYLYFLDADTRPAQDKYVCFLKTLLTLGRLFTGRKPHWNYESRLGMLTLFVKIFYIPYLTSWAINNTFHQKNLIMSFQWDLAAINAFLVALFIYVDTVVYGFGYMVELGFLRNKIKSVEPTLLGWVVCLWCYPPFNVFSFRLFDHQIINISRDYPGWVTACMTCLISALWGVFAWSSVALGFKASNLTNRGIVASGPYRLVRHPAYVAKVLTWLIQGIFFGQYTLGILLGFLVIYYLRAWTEERHLSRDPDYLDYKKRVRWMFVPGIF